VDWYGLDVFDAAHFDQALPDSDRGAITKKGKSERFLAMARDSGRPVYMSEVSAIRTNISADSIDAAEDWNNWFAKFWEFISVHPQIKGFSYIDANWPAGAYPEWGDARVQNSALITQWYREEMRKPKYIHLGSAALAAGPRRPDPKASTVGWDCRNSWSAETVIRWRSPLEGRTRVVVYDVRGRTVAVLFDGYASGRNHAVQFPAGRQSAGIYCCRVWVAGSSDLADLLVAR
jgi:hypothetical protein